jgi:hypothetical protein
MFAASKTGQASGPPADTNFGNVAILMDTDSTTVRNPVVVDSSTSPLTVTRNGGTSTNQSAPFQANGYWSNSFGGTGNYLTTPASAANQLTGDFTVELWAYQTVAAASSGLVGINNTVSSGAANFGLYLEANGRITFFVAGNTTTYTSASIVVTPGAWNHIAFVRSGTTNTVYVNAIVVLTNTATPSWSGTPVITVSRVFADNSGAIFTGYLSNVRVVKGVAVYSGTSTSVANFVVPITPLTATQSAGTNIAAITGTATSLLTCQSNRFVDNSASPLTLTVAGTPLVFNSYPSGFTATTATTGSAIFSIANTDYLSPATSAGLAFGTSAYTVEFWVYLNSYAQAINRVIELGTATNSFGIQINNTGTISISKTGSADVFASSASFVLNQWNHIAVVRTSTAASGTAIYLNGTSVATGTDANNWTVVTTPRINGYTGQTYGWVGYLCNPRIVNGTAVYTGNFTPPNNFLQTSGATSAASYPSTTNVNITFPAANTILLLNLTDGNYVGATDGVQNNTFIDNSNYAFSITRTATATQGSVSPYWPNGYWSAYIPGPSGQNGIYLGYNAVLNIDGAPGVAPDFTMEAWVYPLASGTQGIIFSKGGLTGSRNPQYDFEVSAAGRLRLFLAQETNAGGYQFFDANTFIPLNIWTHVAVTRQVNAIRFYVNGILDGPAQTVTATVVATNGPLGVGTTVDGNYVNTWNGYLSNVRMVKGTALYTGNSFTVPTSPLTSISGTSFLCYQSNRFIDNSGNGLVTNVVGLPRTQPFRPFTAPVSYTPAVYGGSAYVNGTTDYLASGYNNVFNFTPSLALSVEGWVYPTSYAASMFVASRNWSFGGGGPTWGLTPVSATSIRVAIAGTGSATFILLENASLSTVYSIPLNTWTHVAWTRDVSGNNKIFVNGYLAAARLDNQSLNSLSGGVFVGAPTSANSFSQGYFCDVRVVSGSIPTAYQTASTTIGAQIFTPPTTPLTAVTNTALLLNFNNAGLYDASVQNNEVTVGSAQASTTQFKWSPTSMKFNGSTDYLTTVDKFTLQLGTNDFTIEGWVYVNALGVAYNIISKGTATTGWSVNITNTNKLQFSYTASNLTGLTSLTAGTWNYFTVVRAGTATGNVRIYLNGVVDIGSITAITDNFNQTDPMYIGASRTGATLLNGYLQDIRVTKVARYLSNFSVPTTALPTR